MSDLTIVSREGQLVTDSREVAEMVEKRHDHLMRDIKVYVDVLEGEGDSPKMGSTDFFIPSTYRNSQNKEYPCYLLTKKGCEMVANKMTGEKGILFTATYVSKFNEIEKGLDTSNLSPELQMFNGLFQSLAKQEMATKQLENKVDSIRDVVALNTTDWRKDARQLISKMAQSRGGFGAYKEVNNEIYQEVERRGSFDLGRRLTNKRRRLADEGVSVSKRNNLSKVDVIGDDGRLVEVYVAVVKDFAIKHGVNLNKNMVSPTSDLA